MTTRITSKTVTFKRPFIIGGIDQLQPAGTYTVDTEEEQIDAVSFPAWKRVATVILLERLGATEYQRIDPKELHEALMRDGKPEDPAQPSSPKDRARTVRRKKF